ncbi:MAG: MEDS domain-containing protein [Nocardioidaceae bacterium]
MHFYDHDDEAVTAVARYVEEGLGSGERVVVIATAGHRAGLDAALIAHGTDAGRARSSGRFVCLDAAETLSAFMVGGSPDPALFVSSVGSVIKAARADGSRVRAFGEMVAVLWDEGNVAGAISLESMWNDLARDQQFFLLCAYPTAGFGAARLGDVRQVCELHSELLAPSNYAVPWPPASGTDRGQHCELFVPVPEAVGAVRQFVRLVLEGWGEHELVSDATLVTSEMATNAVRHADSPFRAFVGRSAGVIRIAVEDAGGGRAEQRLAAPDDLGGRGIEIVGAVAHRWGCDPLPGGKIVWAELLAVDGGRRCG